MADNTRRGDQCKGTGRTVNSGRSASGPIGETEADEFAPDVAVASAEEPVAHDPGGVAGAAGGGTGTGDSAGGTGIGCDDGGKDAGGTGGAAGTTGGGGS